MSDLEDYLPLSEISKFHKLPAQLRLWKVSSNDIITLNPAEIAKRTNCSASAIVNIRGAIVRALLKKEGHERERIRKEAPIVAAEIEPRLEARRWINDHNYEEFKRLAPDEHRKRKSSEELEEEELDELEVMDAVEELGDDPGIPQSMKKNKRQRVMGPTYEEARAQHDKIKAAPVILTPESTRRVLFQETAQEVDDRWKTVGLLDRQLTRALSGGIAPGYITEVSGESGCGKTQLMLHLLLAVQLPEPIGLSKRALYLSTESGLPTKRVRQLLAEHPLLAQAGPHPETGTGTWPSLDNIYTQEINTLEVQERVMETMVPLLIKRKNIGLVVVDSLTGNYRQEFSNPELGFKENMMRRAKTMRRLGALLREYAKCGVAVVVVNQVSDRFSRDEEEERPNDAPSSTAELAAIYKYPPQHGTLDTIQHDTNLSAIHNRLLGYVPPSHAPGTEVPDEEAETNIALQEQFFSGWGDDPYDVKNLKNPWGGISWTKQLSCRIALIKQLDREANDGSWKRWAKVVFCAWSPNSGIGLRHKAVDYKITPSGIQSCEKEYAEPRTPPLLAEDPYGMENPAVEEAFLELERNWAHQYRDILDEKQEALVQVQKLKMQEPILMTQAPTDVHATHITFDETGHNIANEVLAMPRLGPTSGVGEWNRRTGAASSPVVERRRLYVDEVADTQAEMQTEGGAESEVERAVVDMNHLPIPPMMPKTRNGAPGPHPDSSDDDDDLPNDTDPKNGDEEEPPPRKRFGSEVPDSQAESEDESDYEHMFVEKNSVERQWEADHHVEEAVHIQITDSVEPEDNFLHPHSSQEIQAREAKKADEEKERGEQRAKSPTPLPDEVELVSHVYKVAVEDDAFVPSRPYGEAIRTSEERTNEVVDLTSTMPAPTQLDEFASKKERRAAKKARKEARKAKKAAKPGDDWLSTPESRRFKECIEKYPFLATRDAHVEALKDETNLGAKAQVQGAYELMCVKRAREHNLTLLDWPVAQTPEGEYIDVETGFLMTKEDADCVLGIGQIESPIGNFFSPMRREQRGAEEAQERGDGTEPTTPSRRSRGETPSSAQPRESMMPESPPRKETPIPPPKTWSEKQAESAEKRKAPPILPGAKPPSLPPSTPSLPRKVTGSPLSSMPRKKGAILPGMKPPAQVALPASQEPTVRKGTPVLPPSSPLPFIPDVPNMKRMKKRQPGSQLKQVMNSSDAIEPPQLDDDERVKSKSVDVIPDQRNTPRSFAPLRSSPPLSMPPPPTHVARVQALSPNKARARYSPQQRKRSQLQETYNHSSAPNPSYDPHYRSDFEDISQEDAPAPASPESPRDPPILPGMKPTKPLPLYKTPKHSHKKKVKPEVTPATPLRPDQLPKEDDIDYDALFPSQGESQESQEKQVFINKQGVKYPSSKPGKDFYGAGRSKEVQYPPTKGQRDAEEADRLAAEAPKVMKDVPYPPTKGQRDAVEASEAERIRQETHAHSIKKRVIFKNPPIRALDSPNFDTDGDADGDGGEMADLINFAAFKQTTPKKRQDSGGFLSLTSSPHRPAGLAPKEAPKSAPAKTFHATSVEYATINAQTMARQPKYSSKPSKRWEEVRKEMFEDVPPEGSFEAVIPSSQPETDIGVEGDQGLHIDVVDNESARKQAQEFETTPSDDEYGFDNEMLEALKEVAVPPSATHKRLRQESPPKALPHSSAKRARSGQHLQATHLMGLDGAVDISPHRAGAQKTLSSETTLPVPSPSRQRTASLFERIKAAKAQGQPYPPHAPPAPSMSSQDGYVDGMGVYRSPSSRHGGPSLAFRELQIRSSGTTTIDKGGGRIWRPEVERPMPSIERDEEDVIWETNALKEQAEREMKEAEEREVAASQRARADREAGRVDPGWLYRSQDAEERKEGML